MICERCRAEIATRRETLPSEWFDAQSHFVLGSDGKRRHLRPQAWLVLKILWNRCGTRLSNETIMSLIATESNDNIVRVLVNRVRRALCATPFQIDNVRMLGYRLTEIGEHKAA